MTSSVDRSVPVVAAWRLMALRGYRAVVGVLAVAVLATALLGYVLRSPFQQGWVVWSFVLALPGLPFVVFEFYRSREAADKILLGEELPGYSKVEKATVVTTLGLAVAILLLSLRETSWIELGGPSPHPGCPTGFSSHGTLACGTSEQFLYGQLGSQAMGFGIAAVFLSIQAVLLTQVIRALEYQRAHRAELP